MSDCVHDKGVSEEPREAVPRVVGELVDENKVNAVPFMPYIQKLLNIKWNWKMILHKKIFYKQTKRDIASLFQMFILFVWVWKYKRKGNI